MNEVYLYPTLLSAVTGLTVASGVNPLHELLQRTDRGPATSLRAEMHAVGMNALLLPVYLAAWRGAALAVLVVGWVTVGLPILSILLAGIIIHACPWWVQGRIRNYVRTIVEQMPGVARSLSGSIRIGLPLREAFADTARISPQPAGLLLGACAQQMNAGIDAISALESLKRIQIEPVIALATALQVAETHGRVGDVIDRIGQSAEETARLERNRLSDTASGRLMIRLMGAFPLLFLGFLHTMHPELMTVLTGTFVGECTLAGVTILVYISMRWGSAILNR